MHCSICGKLKGYTSTLSTKLVCTTSDCSGLNR